MSKTEFTLGEFFCGPGGIALAAMSCEDVQDQNGKTYSISPLWATDYDKSTCETYSQNIHHLPLEDDENVIHADIRTLDIAGLKKCDGFAFGFPCNDFSIVGESKGLDGKFGPLFSYGVQYLKKHQPLWFIAENVGGLSSANSGSALDLILKELSQTGYKLVAHLYKFEDYGVPQARHRIIIVGIRNDIDKTYQVPAPSHLNKRMTSKQALTVPPLPHDALNNEKTNQNARVVERLKHIKPGKNAWSPDIPEHLRLNVKGAKLSNIYKRLDPDKPAYTVTGSGGGGTHMYHWAEHRALTNRERARLQTFPDSYAFVGGKENVRKQIGMAVPPMGMKVIFTALLNTFAEKEYALIEKNIEL